MRKRVYNNVWEEDRFDDEDTRYAHRGTWVTVRNMYGGFCASL